MINTRQGGRRRGRGGQRPQGMPGGGGNRQDNRQRGNAAQLLEKYKSLARDAQLSGDRVQTEYYLQFADHYFRVLSESRVRFEEQRRGRDEDSDDGDDDSAETADADGENENEDRPQRRRGRDRDERPERSERRPRRGNGRARDADEDQGEERDERIAFEALPPAIGSEAPDTDKDEAGDDKKPSPRPRRKNRRASADDGEADIAPAA